MVDRARDGKIVVLQMHGVPDGMHPSCSTPFDRFREFMEYLSGGGFRVLALRDIEPWVPENAGGDDPLTRLRFAP